MLKELFREIVKTGVEANQIESKEIEGLTYTNRTLNRVTPSEQWKPGKLGLSSLQAMVDYIQSEIDALGTVFINVVSPECVELTGALQNDNCNQRWVYAVSEPVCSDTFRFGEFYELEKFVIALQSQFVPTATIDMILNWLGKLANEKVINNNDDGFSQSLQIKTGITSKSEVKIENPLTLKPFRTFREVDQPESLFILRLREGKQHDIECALFLADGGAWKIVAMQLIKDWFVSRLPEISVLA
jgi:hypothetical protein